MTPLTWLLWMSVVSFSGTPGGYSLTGSGPSRWVVEDHAASREACSDLAKRRTEKNQREDLSTHEKYQRDQVKSYDARISASRHGWTFTTEKVWKKSSREPEGLYIIHTHYECWPSDVDLNMVKK